MEELHKQKLVTFANDPQMMMAVYDVILNNFLKEKPQYEVYVAAAERIAVDCLRKAWRELESYKAPIKEGIEEKRNLGL